MGTEKNVKSDKILSQNRKEQDSCKTVAYNLCSSSFVLSKLSKSVIFIK